jgi:hypothetical protein
VEPKGPKEALLTWDLADQDQNWNYGVDITYKLKRLGGCQDGSVSPSDQQPITKYNVQDRNVMLTVRLSIV